MRKGRRQTGALHRIRLTTRETGTQRHAWALIYRTAADMRRAAHRFNGNDHERSVAVTQAYVDAHGVLTVPVMRFHQGRLGTQVLSHEVSHTATGIYGSVIPNMAPAHEELTHYNETLAHLHSDLLAKLVNALYRRELIG